MEEGRSQHRKIPQGGTTLRWVYMQKLRSEWCANVEDVREGIKNGERQKQTYILWALLLSFLASTTIFRQNYNKNQLVVTPNEMAGLYCCDQPLKDLLLFLSGLCLVLGSSQRRQFTWCQDLRTCQSGRSQPVPGVQIVECGAKDENEKKIRRKRGKGREEGTPVRFVFKRSFGLFFRLVIRTQFPVLKVVNQVTGDKPQCELNLKKLFLYSSFIFVFYKRICPLLPKMKDLASTTRFTFSAVDFNLNILAAVGFCCYY